jgi:uncharacterized protein YcaQ
MLMPATLSFTLKQARRLALAAQGFNGRQPPATIKPLQLNRLIERLGVLQIDSVNALVRSHYLPLFSRLGNYTCDVLDQAAWSQGRRRTLFEYWGHEASLLPLSMYPLLRWRMQRASRGEDIYQQLARLVVSSRTSSVGFWPLSRRRARWGPAVCRPARSERGRGGTGVRKSMRWNGCSPPVK